MFRSCLLALFGFGLNLSLHAGNLDPIVLGDISPQFEDTLNHSISELPPGIQGWLGERGVRIVAGKFLTETRPDLKGLTPRGYPQGSTWDMSEGLHDRGTVYLPEFKRLGSRGGRLERIDSTRVSQVLHHEVGHAIDFYTGFSQTEEFKAAYEKEKAEYLKEGTRRGRVDLSYFLLNGEAGRKETFGEIFSSLYNPTPSAEAELLHKCFPETCKVVASQIKTLPL